MHVLERRYAHVWKLPGTSGQIQLTEGFEIMWDKISWSNLPLDNITLRLRLQLNINHKQGCTSAAGHSVIASFMSFTFSNISTIVCQSIWLLENFNAFKLLPLAVYFLQRIYSV